MANDPNPADNDPNLERYQRALHAMQTGVAMLMQYDGRETEPKHLRVGMNSAAVTSAALAKLMISKGVITEAEYIKALADQMEEEVESYRAIIADRLGREITLL